DEVERDREQIEREGQAYDEGEDVIHLDLEKPGGNRGDREREGDGRSNREGQERLDHTRWQVCRQESSDDRGQEEDPQNHRQRRLVRSRHAHVREDEVEYRISEGQPEERSDGQRPQGAAEAREKI